MVWVNLLPWRRRRLNRQLRRWSLSLVVIVAACLCALLPGFGLRALNEQNRLVLDHQQQANRQIDGLRARAVVLTQQHQQLQHELAVRTGRQQRLRQWHDFSRRLPGLMPEKLWLNMLGKRADRLQLTGFGTVLADIDDFRQQLQALPLFRQVQVGSLSRAQEGVIHFTLLAVLGGEEEKDE